MSWYSPVQVLARPGFIRRFIPLLIFFCLVSNGFSQEPESIKAIYEILARKDLASIFEKIKAMQDKGLFFGVESPEGITNLIRYSEEQGSVTAIVLSRLLGNSARARIFKSDFNEEEVDEAMTMARLSDKKYLLASAYWVYARIQNYLEHFESMLVYYNASSRLFEELGLLDLKYLYNIDFDIAKGLYARYNYRNCVDYSLRCYRKMEHIKPNIHAIEKVFVLDYLGAGYLNQDMPDSSIIYYEELLDVLESESEQLTEYVHEVWDAIAKGRIGENYLSLGDLSRSDPLITNYFVESTRLGDSLNILLSSHAYASLQYKTGKPKEALLLWKKNLNPSIKWGLEHLSEKMCRGIARIYQDQDMIDSMMHYLDQANEFRRTIEQKVYRSSQETLQQEYEFLQLTSSVQNLNSRVTYMKNTRNYGILIILLVSGILYLFQRKRTFQIKYKSEVEKAKKERAEQELKASMEQLMILKDNLNERNNLARQLTNRIQQLEQSKDTSQLISEINKYILNSPKGWEEFKSTFLKIHPYFLHRLKDKCPSLSPAEIRLSFLLYLKLENAEIANLLGISTTSVSRSKSRLKQKLELNSAENLNEFITSL